MLQVLDAVEKLETYGVRSEIWSATSYGELRREGMDVSRWNRLHPHEAIKTTWVEQQFGDGTSPIIAVSDNVAAVPEMIRNGSVHRLQSSEQMASGALTLALLCVASLKSMVKRLHSQRFPRWCEKVRWKHLCMLMRWHRSAYLPTERTSQAFDYRLQVPFFFA